MEKTDHKDKHRHKNKSRSKESKHSRDGTIRIAAKDLVVKTHDGKRCYPIKSHPYYQSLEQQDKELYEKYTESKKKQFVKPTGQWYGFMELVENIKQNGYDTTSDDPIIIIKKRNQWFCDHGKHRICILRYLYADDLELEVRKKMVVRVFGTERCAALSLNHPDSTVDSQ
jgi:hypothetical protein